MVGFVVDVFYISSKEIWTGICGMERLGESMRLRLAKKAQEESAWLREKRVSQSNMSEGKKARLSVEFLDYLLCLIIWIDVIL